MKIESDSAQENRNAHDKVKKRFCADENSVRELLA